MAKIKLFSGMDFSGKSTTINYLSEIMPTTFKVQHRFITPIKTLQEMIDHDIWLPRSEFIPLLYEMVYEDVSEYRENGPILQDSLWVVKFAARVMAECENESKNEIFGLLELVKKYPDMDSFYLTTTMDKRLERYNVRLRSGDRISRADKSLLNKKQFAKADDLYRKIIFARFPETQILDTTNIAPEKLAEQIANNSTFLKDIGKEE